jgi:effector-binding domain-containing protein
MLSDIELRHHPGGWALVIPATTAAEEIGATLRELIPEAFMHAVTHGAAPSGPPFTRYLSWNPDGAVDLEAGIPLPKPVEGSERIQCIELEPFDAAVVTHTGPYDDLGDAHAALGAWIKANGRQTAGPCLECYVTDPGEVTDAAQWRTEVWWPVR